jgi:hypothetical protein
MGLLLLTIYFFGIYFERIILAGREFYASPLTWFAVPWLAATALLAIPLHEYYLFYTQDVFVYVVLIHVLFTVGCILGTIFALGGPRPVFSQARPFLPSWFITFMLSCGFIGIFVFFLDFHLSSSLSLAERFSFSNLSRIKFEYANPTRVSTFGGIITFIGYYAYGLGQLGLMCFAYRLHAKMHISWLDRRLAYALMVAIVANSIFVTGGRVELIMLMLMYVLAARLGAGSSVRNKIKKKLVLIIGAGIVFTILLLFSIALLADRIGGDEFAVTTLYTAHNAANIGPIYDVFGRIEGYSVLSLQLSYLTAPVPYLGVFLEVYKNTEPELFFGLLNFAPLLASLNFFIGFVDGSQIGAAAHARTAVLSNQGYFGNVWGTLARELLVDFGYYGTLAFFVIFGFLSGFIRVKSVLTPTEPVVILYALIRIQLVFAVAHGLFHHRTFGYAFTLAVFLALLALVVKLRQRI